MAKSAKEILIDLGRLSSQYTDNANKEDSSIEQYTICAGIEGANSMHNTLMKRSPDAKLGDVLLCICHGLIMATAQTQAMMLPLLESAESRDKLKNFQLKQLEQALDGAHDSYKVMDILSEDMSAKDMIEVAKQMGDESDTEDFVNFMKDRGFNVSDDNSNETEH